MGTQVSKKNYEIDFIKFLATLGIMYYHAGKFNSQGNFFFQTKGYLFVEVFFIISGFFMAMSLFNADKKGKNLGNIEFIGHKISAFYPQYIFAFVEGFILFSFVIWDVSFKEAIVSVPYTLSELLLLKNSGITKSISFYNGPTWYLSAMIIAMFVIFPFLKKYKEKFASYIAPIVAVFGYAICANSDKKVLDQQANWASITTVGNIRAFAGICLGIVIFYISINFQKKYAFTKAGVVISYLFQIALVPVMIYIMRNRGIALKFKSGSDYTFVILAFLLLTISFIRKPYLNKILGAKPFRLLYSLSLPLFLTHKAWVEVICTRLSNYSFEKQIIIYTVLVLATAILCYFVSRLFPKIGNKIKNLLAEKA